MCLNIIKDPKNLEMSVLRLLLPISPAKLTKL